MVVKARVQSRFAGTNGCKCELQYVKGFVYAIHVHEYQMIIEGRHFLSNTVENNIMQP